MQSIKRAGFDAIAAIDLFADRDVQRICDVQRADSLDHAMAMLETRMQDHTEQDLKLVVGAGIEHRLLDSESRKFYQRILWPSVESIELAASPLHLAASLKRAAIPFLPIKYEKNEIPESSVWVQKPVYGGGGHGVVRLKAGDSAVTNQLTKNKSFFQQFVDGPVMGASFIAHETGCQLVGVCQQVIKPLGVDQFTYYGSIGPLQLETPIRTQITQMGSVIARECKLSGWFGIDIVLNGDCIWLLEVNSRYTASMEILERLSGQSLFHLHRATTTDASTAVSKLTWPFPKQWPEKPLLGKQYVFNQLGRAIVVGGQLNELLESLDSADASEKSFATDIPDFESSIVPGMPVCTVWASGPDEESVSTKLAKLSRQVSAALA